MGSPSSPVTLYTTPLNGVHRQLGARMVDFANWDMPVQYSSGILAEHHAVRTAAGLFDLSHMGRVHLRGESAVALAQACCTRDLARIRPGEAAYTVLCQPDGGIVDDVIAYVLDERDVMFVFNASNRFADLDAFAAERDRLGLSVDLIDRTSETALIGVQGPQAHAILSALTTVELEQLAGYAFIRGTVVGAATFISRTGYTGEDGFELMVEAADAERVWSALQEGGAVPAGLGARDTLRTEAGFALYGHDIDRTTNPYEARLGWVVDLDGKSDFVGREALALLKAAGPSRRLVGLHVEPGGVPRQGFGILEARQTTIGHVTSGTFSPTLKRNIAMGYVPVNLSQKGQALSVEMRGKEAAAEVVQLPFVAHRTRPRARM